MSAAAGLTLRGEQIASPEELALLLDTLGDELQASATLREWMAGSDPTPHSAGVALEGAACLMADEGTVEREVLLRMLDVLAELFPDEVLPLNR